MAVSPSKVSDRQAQLSESLIIALIQALWRLWSPLNEKDWWDDGLTSGIAGESAVQVSQALTRERKNSRSYATTLLRSANALPKTFPPIQDVYPRANITPAEVYERPAKQYRYAISQGATHEDAVEVAHTRLNDLVESDVQRAGSDEEITTYKASSKVVGYRRVIHPEESKTGTCGLCIVASSRFYTIEDLLPIHGDCHCRTMPITGSADPGLKLNRDDLDAIYEAAGSNRAEELKKTRVRDVMHGELGPMLTREGENWRGPSESGSKAFKKPTLDDDIRKWETISATSERMSGLIQDLIDSGKTDGYVNYKGSDLKITNSLTALKYHQDVIKKTAAKLAALRKQAA